MKHKRYISEEYDDCSFQYNESELGLSIPKKWQKYKNKFVRGTDWNLSGYLLHWSTGALSQNDIGSYASCDQPRAVKINAFSVLNLH